MTKLVVADEASTHIEPRRAMAVLTNIVEELQSSDNIFMTEWVAIFRASGLQDDVTIANFHDPCLKLVVLARAQARELQVDLQVKHAQQPLSAKTAVPTTRFKPGPMTKTNKPVCRLVLKPDGYKNGDSCQYPHPRTDGKRLHCGSESHILQACASPRRQQPSRTNSDKPPPKKEHPKPKGKTADAQSSKASASSDKKKGKGKSKGQNKKTKPSARSGDVDFDGTAQDEQEEPGEPADEQEDEAEV